MKLFKKRTGPNQNIAFISMAVAIIGCFSILGSFIPLSAIFIILVIPAISALSIEIIERKYIIAFIVASIFITFVCSAYDLSCALFYTVPAIISGSVYGCLHKRNISDLTSIFIGALVQLACNYLGIPIINLIYDVDIINASLTALSLQNSAKAYDILPAFLFFYSLAEMLLSYVVLYLAKANMDKEHFKLVKENSFIAPLLAILFALVSFVFMPFYLHISYLFLLFSIYFSVYCAYLIIKYKNKNTLILAGVMLFVGLFLFIFLNPLCPANSSFILFNFINMAISIPAIITVSN